MNPTLLIALLAALFFACGIVVTILAFRRAPDGYEDEAGFHVVAGQKNDGMEAPALPAARPEIRFGALHSGLSPAGCDLPNVREMIGR
jgi:hypothetical protein